LGITHFTVSIVGQLDGLLFTTYWCAATFFSVGRRYSGVTSRNKTLNNMSDSPTRKAARDSSVRGLIDRFFPRMLKTGGNLIAAKGENCASITVCAQ
jgi:hypothetical protein